MAQAKITKRTVDAAKPGRTDVITWDTDLKGFGLKVTPRGAKSYIVQYRMGGRGTPTRRYTIGAHGAPWTPDKARQRAQELLIAVKNGQDPAELERAQRASEQELAFDRYVDRFIDLYAKRSQPRSWEQARNSLRFNAIPHFRTQPISRIGRQEIATLLEEVAKDKAATARYLHATLRKLFRWAVSRGDLDVSPMADMPAPAPAKKRERVLTDKELHDVWTASTKVAFPFGPMTRLLIVTGQRRGEVSGMHWSEIDLEQQVWTIPAERAKNGVAHIVPLSDLALAELRELRDAFDKHSNAEVEAQPDARPDGLIFSTTGSTAPSGWSKAKARLDKNIAKANGEGIPDWRIHDIRRTFATGMQRLGVRYEVTEALLNHVSGSRGGVAGVYQRHNWAFEKRSALVAWARAISRLEDGAVPSLIAEEDDGISQLPLRKQAV